MENREGSTASSQVVSDIVFGLRNHLVVAKVINGDALLLVNTDSDEIIGMYANEADFTSRVLITVAHYIEDNFC